MGTNALDAKAEERKGVLKCQVVSNDRKHEDLTTLATLKQIFSKQLKMPRERITKRWRGEEGEGRREGGKDGGKRGRAGNERNDSISF